MRTNKITEFLWQALPSFVVGFVVTTLLLSLTQCATLGGAAVAAPTCEQGTHQVAGQCAPDPAPAPPMDTAPIGSSLDYATESVLIAEGQNPDTTPVVQVTCPDGAQIWIPEEDPNGGHVTLIWLDDSPLYSGGWLLQVDATSGTVRWLDVHERLTLNDDATTNTATAPPMQTVAHTTSPAPHTFTSAERKAARYILARLRAHKPIEEDWTYAGAPRVVGAHNDTLLDAAEAAGLHGRDWTRSSEAQAWLSQVVRTGKSMDSSHSKA